MSCPHHDNKQKLKNGTPTQYIFTQTNKNPNPIYMHKHTHTPALDAAVFLL